MSVPFPDTLRFGPPSDALEALLDEGSAFVPPSRAFLDLRPDDACRRVEGAPHSIADLLGHLRFWQRYTLALAHGERGVVPEHAEGGWPSTTPDGWDELLRGFLEGLTELRRVAREDDLSRVVRGRDTLGYELCLHALHNAVHVGQAIMLRRMIGAWPPPGGGDTW
ncbi:DinB family protein [Deinococcus sp. KSM4-11]|uniref:DinB family protein n=1 Tax=Deinococcus sp. KSM4-11 TaxID=2568654 RepID=UPI0010A511D6|nr:DinB family protein [Deinococcus sp. KSM4-11]THF83572.1 DinB family protein [Deinococcus sp. KSM4-11]